MTILSLYFGGNKKLYRTFEGGHKLKTFVSADLHMGHWNIVKYTGRPFKSLEEMDNALIRNWNERVKSGDIVYFLGDFCFRNSKGGKPGEGGMTKAQEYESKLNGKIIHFQGNHDKNNGIKSIIIYACAKFGGKKIMMVHRPPITDDDIPFSCDFVLCGHVHEKWDYKIIDSWKYGKKIPVINVGVDVRNFRPMSMEEVLKLYSQIKRNK